MAASKLEEAAFSMPWKVMDFLEMIEKTYAYYFVADIDGAIVGVIGFRDIVGEGEITNVVVDEACRRCGVGRLLVEKALAKAKELGISDVTLEVRASNEGAIKLYEEFGFEQEGVRPHFYERPDEDALIMWRREESCAAN